MRTAKAMVCLVIPILVNVFGGCSPQVSIEDKNARAGIDQQFVQSAECINASTPEGQCLDYGNLKMLISDACTQQNMQLVGVTVKEVNGCDNTVGGAADYQCCPIEPPQPETLPADAPGCSHATVPEMGCLDYGQIKIQADVACKQQGLMLMAIAIKQVDGCDNSTSGAADYQCCAVPPAPDPPPPPDVCLSGTIGDGTCQTYDDLKTAAWNACLQSNYKLWDLTVDAGSCADGLATSLTYSCISGGSCP